jgi:soluble P-type ATPase
MLEIEIPSRPPLRLEHLLLDANGTLTNRGRLIPGVEARLTSLGRDLQLHVLSADTFGSAEAVAAQVGAAFRRVETGEDKGRYLAALGAGSSAAIGNGSNDARMLADAALGIAVLGPEGLAPAAVDAADILVPSVTAALDLLLEPRALAATLRP